MKKNRKHLLAYALLGMLTLSACDYRNTGKSDSPASSESTSETTSEKKENRNLTVSDLLASLKQMATEGIFDVEYYRDGMPYVDTLNTKDGYFWAEYQSYGYGNFPNFPGRKDAFFSFGYEKGELTDVNRLVNADRNTYYETMEKQPSLADINVFAVLNGEELGYLDEKYFTQTGVNEVTVKDNNDFAIYMSILLNYTTTTAIDSKICNTTFTKDSYGYIHFAITTNSDDDVYNRDDYKGVIRDIGTAENSEIANAVKSYTFPTQQISEKAQETLSSTAQEMDYTFYQTEIGSDGVGKTTTIANMKMYYDYEKAFYCTYSSDTVTDAQLYLRYVDTTNYTLTTKALDARTGLATDSFIRTIDDYTYTKLKLYTPGGRLDTSCFYGTGNNEYTYYGGNDAWSLYYMTSEALYLLAYGSTTIKAYTNSDGSLDKMTATCSGFEDSDTGNALVYTLEFRFKDLENGVFPEPEGKKDTEETLAFKKKYIDGKLDGTANVMIEAGNDKTASRVDYIEADDILFIRKYGYDGSYDDGYIHNPEKDTYSGYKYDESQGGLIPFTLKKENDSTFTVESVGYLKAGTIASEFRPFCFASSLIQSTGKENEYKIVLEELVNLKNVLLLDNTMQNIIDMESTSSLLYLEDLIIKTDGEYITSTSYEVAYNLQDEEGNRIPGTTYEQEYTYNVSQNSAVVEAVKSITAKTPLKSWAEESSDIWQTLVSTFGADEAANIPYLFHEQIAGEWKIIQSGNMTRLYVTQGEEFFDDEFNDDYGALLVENGWTRLEDYVEHQSSGEIVTHQYYQDAAGTVITFSDSRGFSPFFDIYAPGTWVKQS